MSADCVLIGEEPLVAPHREQMRARSRAGSAFPPTGSTSEERRPIARLHRPREGLAAEAVALLRLPEAPAHAGLRGQLSGSSTSSRDRVTSPSRSSASTTSRSSSPAGRAPPTRRRTSARRWRNDPRTAPACGPARHARRETGRRPRGHSPHRGTLARQIVAVHQCAVATENSARVRRSTRETLTSTGSTARPKAKFPIAAAV